MHKLRLTKNNVFLLLALLSLLSVFYLYFKTKPSPPAIAPEWKGVKVGSDSRNAVIDKLGYPQSASTSASGTEILSYASKNRYWPDQVYINPDKDKSRLIRERLLNPSPNELKKYFDKYGLPEATLASNDDLPAAGFRLYVFPRSGIAVNASPKQGLVFEVWYFPPTALENFRLEYASEITDWAEPQSP